MPELHYDVRGQIATLTLDRPHRKNAFTVSMIDAWAQALVQAQAADSVRAIVVTGAGGAFCSGIDLDELDQRVTSPTTAKDVLFGGVHRVANALEQVDKPVIAAVDGVAVGAGMDMALLCDYRIASPSARFSEGYIRLGLVPGDGGCWLLPRLIGSSRALRLLWTGEFVPAEQARELGIVDEVADDALGAALAFAEVLASRPPLAVRMIKRAVRQGARHDLPTALDLISSHFAVVASSSDAREARAAFDEGREARFTGS